MMVVIVTTAIVLWMMVLIYAWPVDASRLLDVGVVSALLAFALFIALEDKGD